MNTTNKVLSIGGAILMIAIVLFMALSAAGPAFSASLTALLASTSSPPPGDVIPLKSIDDLTSLTAVAKIDVNGLIEGERVKGDLNAVMTTNDQEESKVTVKGSLLGEIAAQVGGSLVGLFSPSSVDIYQVPEGTYLVVNSFIPVCVKPEVDKTPEELDDLSPQTLLNMLTNSDVARGELVGEKVLNDEKVKHYVLNGDAFLEAAQKSRNRKLRTFGKALWSAEDADLYVDSKGGYPVAFSGSFSGEYEPLEFEGDFDVQVQVTEVNSNPTIKLPASCNNPISP